MPLHALEWRLVVVPLVPAALIGSTRVVEREYLSVTAQDGDGASGSAYAFTRGLPLLELLEPIAREALAAGGDPDLFAERVHRRFRFAGLASVVERVRSLVDLALWDLRGHLAGEPVWRLLGGSGEPLDVVSVVGYVREGDPPDAWLAELDAAEPLGRLATKMMGGSSAAEDAARARGALAGRAAGTPVWLDVHGAWTPGAEAEAGLRELEAAGVSLVEEPFAASTPVEALTGLRAAAGVEVAAGEVESDPRVLVAFADAGVDVLRLDATVLGGVGGFLAAARQIGERGRPVFPHFYPEFHAALASAAPNALAIEIVPPWTTGLAPFMRWPVEEAGGRLRPPERPGFGIEWDREALGAHTVRLGSARREG